MEYINWIYGIIAVICAALLAYCLTPPVRVLAYRLGAVDVPTDGRRMHKKPIPRLGGMAIFLSFLITSLIFCKMSPGVFSICVGGFLICVLGLLDDIYRLHWAIKLVVQVVAATIAALNGVRLEQINFGGSYISFGLWSIPLTVLWIVGLSNAINLIDGLDGLACGVSAICSFSLVGVMLLMGDFQSALLTAILSGACIGFLPFNRNPARIFMGDTGALFLGYALAILSVEGVFKLHTIISFAMPISIFAIPLFDTVFAFFRRILHGKSPFSADRGHLHHRLVDMGFTQKESVGILYAACGIMGLVAVTFTDALFRSVYVRSVCLAGVAVLIFVINCLIMKNPSARYLSGLFDPHDIPPEQAIPKEEKKDTEESDAVKPDTSVFDTPETPVSSDTEKQPPAENGDGKSA